MHRELLYVKIFDPTSLRNANFSIGKELNIGGCVDLQRSYQHVIDITWFHTNRCQSIYRAFIFFTNEFSPFAKATAPAFVQRGEIGWRSSIDNCRLAVPAYENHPKIELHPFV